MPPRALSPGDWVGSLDATLCSPLLLSANLGHGTLYLLHGTGCQWAGWAVGAGDLALEAQLLVLGGDVIPEKLQGLAHGALSVCSKVPGMLALQDLDDDF